jgi:hypothetical protein
LTVVSLLIAFACPLAQIHTQVNKLIAQGTALPPGIAAAIKPLANALQVRRFFFVKRPNV